VTSTGSYPVAWSPSHHVPSLGSSSDLGLGLRRIIDAGLRTDGGGLLLEQVALLTASLFALQPLCVLI
jgi:hypothetical protein